MNVINLGNHEFTTDGSRLICDESFARTIDFIGDLTQGEVKELAAFVTTHMPWMDTNYEQGELDEVRDSIHPIFEGINEKQRKKAIEEYEAKKLSLPTGETITAYENFPDNPKLSFFEAVPVRKYNPDFIQATAIIYHASAPYLWNYDFTSAIDGFYTPYQYPQEAYASRNRKEFITQCFGTYTSTFPEMDSYLFSSLFAAFPNKRTPIEHVAEIAAYYLSLNPNFRNSIEYLPFVMHTPEIGMTPKRLLNWLRNNSTEAVTTLIAQLVEVHDIPYVETVSARGSFKNVQKHCNRNLNLGIERMHESELEQYTDIFEAAQGKVAEFNRKPDANFDKYAVYMVRSALELADLGKNLEVCLGGPKYSRRLENNEASFFVIEGENRQYVAHIEHGDIVELRGWKNHTPNDDTIIKAAQTCSAQLLGV